MGGFTQSDGPFCMIGRAHQWATLHVSESLLQGDALEVGEGFGRDIAGHGQVVGRGLEILAYGEPTATRGQDVVHQFHDFLIGLAQANHEACLGLVASTGHGLQHTEAAVVAGHTAHRRGQSAHGLHVVPHHMGLGGKHLTDELLAPHEIGDEQFDAGVGTQHLDRLDGLHPVAGSQVGQVVAVDRCEDGIAQSQRLHRLGHAPRLIGVEGGGATGAGVAESAPAGADVAADHQRRGACRPALRPVGAEPRGADGVEVVASENIGGFTGFSPAGQVYL